jgi:hypothetical protein
MTNETAKNLGNGFFGNLRPEAGEGLAETFES